MPYDPRLLNRRQLLAGLATFGAMAGTTRAQGAVTRVSVRGNGVVGTLFLPPNPAAQPAVVCLTGAMGGLWEAPAQALAAEGFAALALAMHNFENLPPRLRLLPLEAVARAVDWMRLRVSPKRDFVAVRGWSRGGEAALLAASLTPTINAVIAYEPRCYVGREQDKPNNFDDPTAAAAWTWDGQPVVGVAVPRDELSRPAHDRFEDYYGIPVERIKGPIMLVAGEADTGLAGTNAIIGCEYVMRRLENFKVPYHRELWTYPDAGHSIAGPPPFVGPVEDGGTFEGDRSAVADSWQRGLAFLRGVTA